MVQLTSRIESEDAAFHAFLCRHQSACEKMKVDGVTQGKLLERYNCGRSKTKSQVEEISDFKQSSSCVSLPYNDGVMSAQCHEPKVKKIEKSEKKSVGRTTWKGNCQNCQIFQFSDDK